MPGYVRATPHKGQRLRPQPTPEALRDIGLELEALDIIACVQDSGDYGGRCPNWKIPARIPVQRLQGLRRRGRLDYAKGEWWLTELGIAKLKALRDWAAPLAKGELG